MALWSRTSNVTVAAWWVEISRVNVKETDWSNFVLCQRCSFFSLFFPLCINPHIEYQNIGIHWCKQRCSGVRLIFGGPLISGLIAPCVDTASGVAEISAGFPTDTQCMPWLCKWHANQLQLSDYCTANRSPCSKALLSLILIGIVVLFKIWCFGGPIIPSFSMYQIIFIYIDHNEYNYTLFFFVVVYS